MQLIAMLHWRSVKVPECGTRSGVADTSSLTLLVRAHINFKSNPVWALLYSTDTIRVVP